MTEKNGKINYSVFLWVGVAFMGIGVVFMLVVNTIMGLALLAVGAGNFTIGLSARNQQK